MIENQIKTVLLLGLLTGVLLWVGQLVGGPQGLTFAIFFAVLMNVGSYWFSDKIVLRMYRAKEVKENESPRLYKIVREVAQLANLPMPKVYVIPSSILNAFATGRDYTHAAVAFTEGILKELNDEELKGVTAHEIAHIKNRDTLISTVSATIAGIISYVAFMARWAALFGGFGGRDRDGGNVLELLVLAIVTPLVATIIQLAISRSREFLADATGAKTIHNGDGLARALEKLESASKKSPIVPTSTTQSTAHLFIVNPFSGRSLMKLFSTHPAVAERAKRLRSMTF